jgi:hypothetical protein
VKAYNYIVRVGVKAYGPFPDIRQAEEWGKARFTSFEVLVMVNPDRNVEK